MASAPPIEDETTPSTPPHYFYINLTPRFETQPSASETLGTLTPISDNHNVFGEVVGSPPEHNVVYPPTMGGTEGGSACNTNTKEEVNQDLWECLRELERSCNSNYEDRPHSPNTPVTFGTKDRARLQIPESSSIPTRKAPLAPQNRTPSETDLKRSGATPVGEQKREVWTTQGRLRHFVSILLYILICYSKSVKLGI